MVRKLKAISGMKGVRITLKKGDRVITTGKGKTKIWGDIVGKVTKRRGNPTAAFISKTNSII
jgi:hypothetical protein